MLAYCLSWFILTSGPENGLTSYVFFQAILFAKGERLALAPLYPGFFNARLEECVGNVVSSVDRYNVLTDVVSSFL